MKNVPVYNSVHQNFSKNAEDPFSNFTMSEYSFESKSALFSTGDGDCLFNSVSILLVGDESMSLELRYRCCIEMVKNKSKIKHMRRFFYAPKTFVIIDSKQSLSTQCILSMLSADPNEMSPMWHPIRNRTVYRSIPEYRILRRTFQRKSVSKS